MLVESKKITSITKLQKNLARKVKETSETSNPVFILKNNRMEAVLVSFEDFERLKEIEEIVEHFEIGDVIQKRMKKYDSRNNISWSKIREV